METVFVTGGTGVLGRDTVEQLLAAGHTVRVLARNADRAEVIAAMGAEPVVADLFDADAITRALTGVDTVMHLATRIPPASQFRQPDAWAENNRLREVGTGVLVDAALATGVRRVIAESITFIYGDHGAQWIDERTPVDAPLGLEAVVTLEQQVQRFTEAGGTGIALRFGSFYGAEARSTEEYLEFARRRIAPALGPAKGYVSSIETHDAARATVAALGAPAGVFNIVDDRPLTRREYADAFSLGFGLHHLFVMPPWLVRMVGGAVSGALMRSQRVNHEAFTAATGWTPRHPNAIEGWAAVAEARKEKVHA